jgi:hypothetical protein
MALLSVGRCPSIPLSNQYTTLRPALAILFDRIFAAAVGGAVLLHIAKTARNYKAVLLYILFCG